MSFKDYLKEQENLVESDVMSKSKEEIEKWLDSMKIKNYTIDKYLTVNVNGDVDLKNKNIKEIPVQFGKVTGFFSIGGNKKLISLVGSPNECEEFSCANCTSLKSLVGATKECTDFYCNDCTSLTSLVGSPEKSEEFSCSGCVGKFTEEGVLEVCNAKK